MSTPAASGPAADDRIRWQAFGVSVAAAALTILDLSKVNVALASIGAALPATSSQQQLIVAGYTLAFGLTLIPAGRLGDMTSRRLLFLIGLAGFGVTSLLCGLAPNAETLLIARALQGISAGIIMPQMLGMLQSMFTSPRERGRVFGAFGGIIGLATAFGPTIGGLLILLGGHQDGWRWTFWMNVPIAAVLLPIAARLLPRTQASTGRQSLDLTGLLLIGGAVFSLMLPFVLTTGRESDDPRRWFWLIAFGLLAFGFVLWERRFAASGRTPAVNLALLRLRSYRYGILVGTCYFAAMPATFLVVALFLQQGLHLEPVFSGMVTIPFALASAATAFLGGRLVVRFGRSLVLLGIVVVLVGFSLLGLAAVHAPVGLEPWFMAAAFLLAGLGGGFVVTPNQALTLSQVPPTEGGVAGSVVQVAQRSGNAIGVAAVSTAFFATVFRESGGVELVVYHDAIRNALFVSLAFLALAVLFALLDRDSRLPETAAIAVQQPEP